MKRKKRQREKFRFKRMQKVIVVFLALVAVLCVVQRNVTYTHQDPHSDAARKGGVQSAGRGAGAGMPSYL